MLSSRVNTNPAGRAIESNTLGDYGQWSGVASRVAPSIHIPPEQPSRRSMSRPRQAPSMLPRVIPPTSQGPFIQAMSPSRIHQSRSITPDVVIERRHHRHRHHHRDSSEHHRVIRIPLDNHPTLGLRGPPSRILEIERVRCRRRRKRYKSCYEIDYDTPPQPTQVPLQSQPNLIFTDPTSNLYSPQTQSALMTSNNQLPWILNLSPELIENLPKQTVFLPPIVLPGSQPNANTELETVVFPTEIIDPFNGTLSIIKSNSTADISHAQHVQPVASTSVQPSFINTPTNINASSVQSNKPQGPFMQQVQGLLQRLTLSANQSLPSLVNIPQSNMNTIPFRNPQTILPNNTTNIGPYSAANIQMTNTPNNRSYNLPTLTPSNPNNTMVYAPANITPYRPVTSLPSNSTTSRPYQPANITPYHAANTTPYRPANVTSYQPANNLPPSSYYSPANITPYPPVNTTPYQSARSAPTNSSDIGQYAPANISTYQSLSITPSNSSDMGPYAPANITPYSTMQSLSGGDSLLRPSISSVAIPSSSPSSAVPSNSLNSHQLSTNYDSKNAANSLQSLSRVPQSTNAMPKSILRNATTSNLSTTTNSDLNPPIISLPNNNVRKTAFL